MQNLNLVQLANKQKGVWNIYLLGPLEVFTGQHWEIYHRSLEAILSVAQTVLSHVGLSAPVKWGSTRKSAILYSLLYIHHDHFFVENKNNFDTLNNKITFKFSPKQITNTPKMLTRSTQNNQIKKIIGKSCSMHLNIFNIVQE